MDIGEPKREIEVQPLQLPEPLRPAEEPERIDRPADVPEREPVHHE